MIFRTHNASIAMSQAGISLRCHACRQLGTFEWIGSDQVIQINEPTGASILGQRRCPNLDCRAHVFVAWNPKGEVLVSYPPERIDFDPSKIPAGVVKSLEEAITCHANEAYTAAAVMIRRTLEDLCADKSAKGENLQERLSALSGSVILPTGLIAGLDNLRLLGNDAAHVESRVYSQVGTQEVELAIDVAKEVLKAVYQLDDLVSRLEKLKKTEQ